MVLKVENTKMDRRILLTSKKLVSLKTIKFQSFVITYSVI